MKHIFILIMTSLFMAACSSDGLKRAGYEMLRDVDCDRNEGISNCAYDVENRQCWRDSSNSEDCETYQDYDAYQVERERYLKDKSDKDVDCQRNEGISNCAYDVENRQCLGDISNSENLDCETYQDYDSYQAERKRYLNDNNN